MNPNHPYSLPTPHTLVTLFISNGESEPVEQAPGYHDGGQFWLVDGNVELRVIGWAE